MIGDSHVYRVACARIRLGWLRHRIGPPVFWQPYVCSCTRHTMKSAYPQVLKPTTFRVYGVGLQRALSSGVHLQLMRARSLLTSVTSHRLHLIVGAPAFVRLASAIHGMHAPHVARTLTRSPELVRAHASVTALPQMTAG